MKEKQDNVIQFKSRRTGLIAKITILVLAIALVLLFTSFHIESIEVTGTKHYSTEQITDYVLANG